MGNGDELLMSSSFVRSCPRRGAIMVLSLWLIIVLMVMAYSLAYEMRLGMKLNVGAQRRLKALGLARLGVARAVADLRNDRLTAFNNPTNYNDTLSDIWVRDEEDHLDVELDPGKYSFIVRDENRKMDLNMLRPQGAGALAFLLND